MHTHPGSNVHPPPMSTVRKGMPLRTATSRCSLRRTHCTSFRWSRHCVDRDLAVCFNRLVVEAMLASAGRTAGVEVRGETVESTPMAHGYNNTTTTSTPSQAASTA